MASLSRIPLGRASGLAGRQHVYEGPAALEVDDYQGYAGQRRRVFYDEVLLITQHQRVSWIRVALLLAAAGLVGLVALMLFLSEQTPAALAFLLLAVLPLAALAILRMVVKIDVITVYGKRSQARVQFWLRKQRAREVFQRICARVRQAQERAR